MKKNIFYITAAVFIAGLLCLSSCSDDETDIGINLQDENTLYDGITDTAYGVAYTVFDDSLTTSGQSSALVGCYQDNVFGTSEAIIYTQINPPDDGAVEFDQYCTIDSVVMTLKISSIYEPESKAYHNMHFEIYQLADTIDRSAMYYSSQTMPVNSTCFYNDVTRIASSDTMIATLRLRPSFAELLSNHTYATSDAFNNAMKGMRIRLVNDGVPSMATVNLSASDTRITVYFTFNNGNQSIERTYEFTMGNAPHFNHYTNNYIGVLSTFNTNHKDSIDGTQYLYMSPMGGTNVRINFGDFIKQFRQQHPFAVIHYAELLLPVADISPGPKPDMIATLYYKNASDTSVSSIPDLYDEVTYRGYDGTYHSGSNVFRLRITQHWQNLINKGQDYGTLLVINQRRTSAAHAILNGYSLAATNGNPIRVAFVYTEL